MSTLFTSTMDEMQDEAELREYIQSVVDVEDADRLAQFAWIASQESNALYLTHLAQICRTIAVHGPDAVQATIREARKSKDQHTAEVAVALYAKQLVEKAAENIGTFPEEERPKVTAKQWKGVLRKMRKKLVELYPEAKEVVIDKAIAIGCVWDQQEETFGIEPMKLVDAMRSPPP